MYSYLCNTVKEKPKISVIHIWKAALWFWIKLWWAQVTVTPLVNNNIVFNNGILKGLMGVISLGGHTNPHSTGGANLLSKKAQKKDKKKENLTHNKQNKTIF